MDPPHHHSSSNNNNNNNNNNDNNTNNTNPAATIEFLRFCSRLKRTLRTGWVHHGVKNPESVADHMHRMGILSMLIQDPSVDRDRCLRMSIVHDLGEAIVGDITPHQGVSDEDKHQQEAQAMDHLTELLRRDGLRGPAEQVVTLWQEYEEQATPESRIVKDMDRFEMVLQAFEYEHAEQRSLPSFFETSQGKFQHPEIRRWADYIYSHRFPGSDPHPNHQNPESSLSHSELGNMAEKDKNEGNES